MIQEQRKYPKLRLQEEREARGWSQAELCRRTGIHPTTLSRLEGGKVYPYPGWKRRLSRALGIPGDELFQGVEQAAGREHE